MNSEKPSTVLRTAVIGLGRIGFGYHCPAVAAHPGFALEAVCDPLPERRMEATAKWRARGFDDVAKMLAAIRLDLVVVASPNPFHRAHAAAALAAGSHVFCDKPVVETTRELDELAAIATHAGRSLVAYQPSRFQPEVRSLRSLLATNVLGPVHLIRRTRDNFVRRQDWQAFRANGGGMLNNYGSHCLDEILVLLGGAAIERVYCQTRCAVTAGDAEDFVKATLTAAGGTVIDLEISQACALPGPEWELFGSRGAARWEAEERVWQVRRFEWEAAPPAAVQDGFAAAGRLYQTESLPWREEAIPADGESFDYYAALWQHYVNGAAAPVRLDETRALIALIERCRRSAAENLVT